MRLTSASIRAPRKLDITQYDIVALAADEVLVQVEHSGVCGSDLHFFEAGAATPGTPFGHEITGRVVKAAAAHVELLNARVVVNPYVFCGQCRHCTANRPINCEHRTQSFETGFSTHALVTVSPGAANIFVVPDGMPSVVAALAEPMSVAIHAVARAYRHVPQAKDTALDANPPRLVLGAGPIGLLITAFLTQSLGERVWVLDRANERQKLATITGAERTFGAIEELSAALATLPGQDAPIVGSGPVPPIPVVFECSGAASLLALAAHDWVGRGGVVCQVAVFSGDTTFSVNSLLRKEADLVTSYAYSSEDWPLAIEFLATHGDTVTALVTERHGLYDVESLLADTADGRIARKPVVRIAH